jgi:type VI secretion system protein ImpL
MRKVIEFFKKRWVIQLLGLIALSVILWFVIPLFTLEEMVLWVRLGAIGIILLIWILSLLLSLLKARKTDQEMMEDIAQPETSAKDLSAEELGILKERFDEALEVLKKGRKSNLFNAGQHLYELPWYVIIGPPGSGKTTALINSGLKFPLSDRFGKDAIRGVGGTRNCDWWFTDDAVLLDTAGRYTTQDSQEAADAGAWLGFLDLLKKHRKRRPVNGILVAASLSDILMQTEEERTLHARAIRNRIQELNDRLGVRVPVYMLFTKSDLVAGFTEFFDDLGREERSQVWGMTLDLDQHGDQEPPVKAFPQEFDGLLQRINDRMLARMYQERDVQRRSLIYGFPQEMAALREPLTRFLEEVFLPSRFEIRPLLRGIYFTSGTQEGTPIDRLLGNIAQSFGLDRISLPAFSGRGRSYFIQDLFRDIIFPEAGIAGTNKKVELRRAWLQRGAYAGAIGLTILMALAWTTSFTRNQMGIKDLEAAVAQYEESLQGLDFRTADFDHLLQTLDDLRQATNVYTEETPFTMGLGLYQGDKLDPAAHNAYKRVLSGRFLHSLGMRLETHLQPNAPEELLREALKSYLMLGHPQYLNAESLRLFMSVDLANLLPNEREKQSRLLTHLDALLASKYKPLPLNANLVQQARLVLTRIKPSRQVYNSLQKLSAADNSLDFLLSATLGRHGDQLFSSGEKPLDQVRIPGLYTKVGYYRHFVPESERLIRETLQEHWVLSDAATAEISEDDLVQMQNEVNEYYVEDYIKQWKDLLNSVKIVKLSGLSQAVEALDIATGRGSPMRKLLQAVEENTTLTRLPEELKPKVALGDAAKGATEAAAEISSKAESERRRLQQLMRAADKSGLKSGSSDEPDELIRLVDEEFERLNNLVQKRGDNPTPLDAVIGDLADLLNFLSDLEAAADSGSAALDAAKGAGGSKDPVKLLRRRANRLPNPVDNWVYALSERGWDAVVGTSRNQLSNLYKADVAPLCKRAIQGRYPFVKSAQKEVTLSDFSTFFAPGGVMDNFFQEQIKPFANTLSRPWRWHKASGHPMGISTRTLRQFERAASIREVFFSAGKRPKITFSLKPSQLDADVSRFLLDLDGQKITYRHGPARSTTLTWPSPEANGQVRVVFEDLNGKTSSLSHEGPWAWFKLLDQMDVQETQQSDRFLITFEAGGHSMRYELRASSVINPFRMPELEEFRCPDL